MEITLLSPKVWDKIQTAAEFYPYESHISKILRDYVNKVKPKFYDVKTHNEKTIFFSMLKVSFFRIPNREKKHLFPNILAVILEKDGYYVYEELDEKKLEEWSKALKIPVEEITNNERHPTNAN